jgi:alkanesulfonate monooxygenase SsuD/methylene tetrahydromethanopterin reductase-like flavin-dependent oxidoreductase (luciferase family)
VSTTDSKITLGLSFMPFGARIATEAARSAEAAGFDSFGLPDSQVLWSGLYSTLAMCAAATSTLRVGPNVTNVVTRHWTTTAAEFRALAEFADGRLLLGLGTGDGAVYGIGRKPAKAATLETRIELLKEDIPGGVTLQVAAGGPRIAAVAGATGADAIIGTGAELAAIDELRAAAAAAAGGDGPEPWLLMIFNLAEEAERVGVARDEVRASVMAYTRHSLATRLEDGHVPERIAAGLAAALGEYDFHSHARPGDSANARLVESLPPPVLDYLEDRFAVVGTPETAAARIEEIAETTGIRKFWLACNVADPVAVLSIADRMTSRLTV